MLIRISPHNQLLHRNGPVQTHQASFQSAKDLLIMSPKLFVPFEVVSKIDFESFHVHLLESPQELHKLLHSCIDEIPGFEGFPGLLVVVCDDESVGTTSMEIQSDSLMFPGSG